MALKEEFKKSGDWLFKWRSFLPLPLVAVLLVACRNIKYPYDSYALEILWEIFCLLISFLGLGIRIFTIGHVPLGTSGRNTRGQIANVLNTTGIYSIVRHPLYLGNLLIWLGISLFPRLWWFSLIIILIFWIYYERIMFAEEEFLQEQFGESFSVWADKTPAFIPRFRNWTKPDLPFSLRNAIKREYTAFFAIIVTFTVLALVAETSLHGKLGIDRFWIIIFGIGLAIYLTIRILNKYTTLLNVEGR
ncbi:MAG: isoprenylcysteine carboxylmethyltransferase family protein [Desulfobaccales bacterium]|nr:isoprenylcysteine carboxylmethyltransferase family protein [Desulfobaccales bacterium]